VLEPDPQRADAQGLYYEALLRVSPLATVTLDPEANVTSWNPAAEELFGYSCEEAVGRRLDELVATTPEPHAEAMQLSEEAAREGRTTSITRRSRKDGTLVDVEVIAAPVLSDGAPAGHIAIYRDISERMRADEGRRSAEKWYLDLIKRLPLTVYIDRLDDLSSNVYTSPQLESVLGYTAEEWTSDPELFFKVVHPDDRERVLAEHIRTRQTGDPFRMEYRMIAKDGTVRWFMDQASVVADERTGLPAYDHGFLLDITERKELEEALRAAEKRYRDLVEELPLAVYIDEPTPEAASRYISPQIEGMLGYRTEDWLTDQELFPKLLDPDDRQRVLAEHERALKTGQSRWAFEYQLTAKDGRPVWVRDEAVIVKDEDGTPLYVQGFLIDITERQLAEQALRESEEELRRQKQYFESLVEISPTAVVTLDLKERVTSWNPAAVQLFGWSESEAVGREIGDLVLGTPELREEGEVVSETASEVGSAHLITRRSRKDGSLVDVDVLMVPLVLGGRPSGFYLIYHDIGELQRARHEAEAATQAKSVFLATMSHEIRTPMAAVIGMADLLSDTELDEEQRGFVEVILTSGDSLLRVIDDVLDFSKIESGKLELEHRPFELRACVESALELMAARAAKKNLELGCLIDSDVPPEITGDVTRLRQVLINLVGNALKFTEDGEVVVSVRREGSGPIHLLHLAVRDTGIGIPEERLGQLFQSFSQVDASTSRRFGGTGLGLAISKRLSELMGGTMWAESAVGRGSSFHFTFIAEPASVPAPPHAGGDDPQLHGKRLLVVDDNATNREIVMRQAQSWGMLTRSTGRPTEALAWVERGDTFDAAILDMQMPEMDGLALARSIRGLPAGRTLPLVLLTSLGRKERSRGAREFAVTLTKPVRSSQLYDALVAILARRPEEGEEPEASAEAASVPAAAAEAAPARAAAATRSGLRVLVAEDTAVNQKLALALLGKLGYEADVVGNGIEALEAVERERYDVVLMDIQMPELDGLEATRRIRRRHPRGPPRIIAMTANALQEDRDACFAAGMDDYVAKPIRVGQLAEALAGLEPLEEEGPPLTPGALDALREQFSDEDFVQDLVDTFLREAPQLVADLRSGNREKARRAAHTLKSNARTIGAAELGRLCEELEELAKKDRLDRGKARVARAAAEYVRVEAALRAAR
jgi:PAS domain S-box-containing protein